MKQLVFDFGGGYHADIFFLLPAVLIQRGECECCGEPGGYRLGFSIFVWSAWVSYSPGGHGE